MQRAVRTTRAEAENAEAVSVEGAAPPQTGASVDARESTFGPHASAATARGRLRRDDRAPSRACRVLNVLVATIGLLLAGPIMLILALIIRLTSRGPVLFAQTRIGLDRRNGSRPIGNCRRRRDLGGQPFRIYKFRTMEVGSDNGEDVWARPDDPRVTPIGRLLRKYRLDELPQLFNVLRGHMNIVGPRPEQPQIFRRLRKQIDRYAERQAVLPGITGWAQVNHHYDRSIDDVKRKLQFDLEYIDRHSVWEDLKIMLRTIPVILFRRGAW